MENNKPSSFWSPMAAGIGLGIALMSMFVFTTHGLGAYGAMRRFTVWLSNLSFPEWTQANSFFSYMAGSSNIFNAWIMWEVLGVAIGALAGSLVAKRFKFKVEKGASITVPTRLILAVIGGAISGFGAGLARGCSSGLGLSGASMLSVGAFVFLGGFFIAALIASRITRKVWS